MSSRNSVLRGTRVELLVAFLNGIGQQEDPDPLSELTLTIYPPGCDPRLGDYDDQAWVKNVTMTSPGTGLYVDEDEVIERLAEGSFRYTFMVPVVSPIGIAFDRWRGTVDEQDLDETFSFIIVGGGSLGITQLLNNNVVLVELKSSIAATDGSTLGQDYRWHFTTTYDPLYTSARRIRLDIGPLIKDVSDDTINLAIFEASLEADALTFGTLQPDNWKYFYFARRMYTTCLAEMILLGGILGSGGNAKSKRLGDLDISYGGNAEQLMKKAISCMSKYESVLTSAGVLASGTSLQPQNVIKGEYDPDRPNPGRDWEPTSSYLGAEVQMPAANTKSQYTWKRRKQADFAWPGRWNPFWKE